MSRIRRALLSVSDKTGIVELAQALTAAGVEILSTGGTAKALQAAGMSVTEVSAYTGFPEMMDGRVKTLHPKVHGALLGREGIDDEAMAAHAMAFIDLLVVNLYPFAATIARADCTDEMAIENIDIGGPAMIRAASKNHARVAVLTDPADYADFPVEGSTLAQRRSWAAKAYAHTAQYDAAVAGYLREETFPETLSLALYKSSALRYGENPHQDAAFYRHAQSSRSCVANAQIVQGKALSYNNIADTDAALECVRQFDAPACVIVKHANPCGVAVAVGLQEAYELAYRTDTTSAFGGIIAFNRVLDADLAATIIERQFVEVIIAPRIDAGAIAVLAAKPNVRVLECGDLSAAGPASLRYASVGGGVLVQQSDDGMIDTQEARVVSQRVPSDQERADLLFAWKVAKFVKSNAIVYAQGGATVGIGAGQMSRIDSARIAVRKAEDAQLPVQGSMMASDAFFPFRDAVDAAAAAGVAAIIQPGGSMRDNEIIAAADEHGLAMLFTGMRHFRH